MQKKQFNIFFIILAIVLFLQGCGAYQGDGDESSSTTNMHMMDDMAGNMEEEAMDREEMGMDLDIGEKVIETAFLDFETLHFDEALAFINETTEQFEANIQHSSRGTSTSSYGYIGNYISLTIRVPQDNLQQFVATLNEHDQLYILHQEMGQQDVTRNYRDNETRIEILQEEETVLRQMLEEQGSLEEILQVRTRLSEVITERENLENQNRNYDQEINYSTVSLNLQQTERVNEQDVSGFWDRLVNSFSDSFYRFIVVLQNLVISLVYMLPFIVIIGIVAYIAYRIYKWRQSNKSDIS